MNEIQKSTQETERITQPENKFKGYTLEELRYQRALVLLQKEFCKSRITRNVNHLQKNNPLSPSSASGSLPGKVGFVASKLLTGLNYLDYAMIGFSLFGTARKIFSIFRRKKK
jgi:hypothetical protein